ncbi:hypothetical protein PAEPH01_0021 [Pancytospora epiphaga]|nr:hypothetical protein PAEPH01_0021 [Pancytospora epiphaga]
MVVYIIPKSIFYLNIGIDLGNTKAIIANRKGLKNPYKLFIEAIIGIKSRLTFDKFIYIINQSFLLTCILGGQNFSIPPSMKKYGENRNLKSIVTTILITLVASPIFVQSFGKSLLTRENSGASIDGVKENFENESRMIYIGSSIYGQIGYSLFSTLSGGFFIFPTFENSTVSAKIHKTCMENNPRGFVNTLFFLFLSSLLSGLVAFILSFTEFSRLLDYIPLTLIIITMVASGTRLFLFGCSLFVSSSNLLQSGVLVLISVVITLTLMLLLKKYRNPLIMLYYVLAIILVMNLFKLIFSLEQLYKWSLFSRPPSKRFSLHGFLEKIHLEAFDFSVVLNVWPDIISMGLFPIIQFGVSLPIYSYELGIPFNTSTELRAFGISNLLSSLAFYPTYFNCSGSLLFHMCGSNTRIHSIIAGFTMILLCFFFHSAAKVLPTFSVSLLLQFVGISFLLSHLPMVFKTKALDMFSLIVMITVCIYFSLGTAQLLAICLLLTYFLYIYHSRSFTYNGSTITVIENPDNSVIKVSGHLGFYNVNNLVEHILNIKKTCTIDLEACNYIDMAANFKIRKAVDTSLENGIPLHFSGRPNNFYKHLYDETYFITSPQIKTIPLELGTQG